MTIIQDLYGRISENSGLAGDAYIEVARKHDLDPSQMAIAFCNQRPFVCSTIIGATTMEQLKVDIASIELELDDEVLEAIEAIHQQHPNRMQPVYSWFQAKHHCE